MKKPYLIQRGKIKHYKVEKLSNAVDFDYMGSSEFEFGALGKSLRVFKENPAKGREIEWGFGTLYTFSVLSDVDHEAYENLLSQVYSDKLQLKEPADFRKDSNRTNFWWDIENHVMWSFDKKFMKNIEKVLQESFKVMK